MFFPSTGTQPVSCKEVGLELGGRFGWDWADWAGKVALHMHKGGAGASFGRALKAVGSAHVMYVHMKVWGPSPKSRADPQILRFHPCGHSHSFLASTAARPQAPGLRRDAMKTSCSSVLALAALVRLGLLPTCLAVAACFFPNGEVAQDMPCNASAAVGVCCGGYPNKMVCLDGGRCQENTGTIYRGTCTDQTWSSPECPQFCSQCPREESLNSSCVAEDNRC